VDSSAPDRDEQIEAVHRVLREIGADAVPQLLVYNKIDASGREPGLTPHPCGSINEVSVSALTGAGLSELRQLILSHHQSWLDRDAGRQTVTETSSH
jgi:GTP-binding protein HflX